MSKFISFLKVKGAAAAVALALSLGALTPAGAYNYTGFQLIATHDQWRSFSVRVDDVPTAGALTQVGKERLAALLLLNHHVILTLSAEPWNLKPNDEVAVNFTIQDKKFVIKGHAVSDQEVALDIGQDQDFLKRLINADQLIVQVQGENWKLSLGGLDVSLAEAIGVIKKIDASL
jgi:hypothetical protein